MTVILIVFADMRSCGVTLRPSGYYRRAPVEHMCDSGERQPDHVGPGALNPVDEPGAAPLDGIGPRLPVRFAGQTRTARCHASFSGHESDPRPRQLRQLAAPGRTATPVSTSCTRPATISPASLPPQSESAGLPSIASSITTDGVGAEHESTRRHGPPPRACALSSASLTRRRSGSFAADCADLVNVRRSGYVKRSRRWSAVRRDAATRTRA